jgi:hypothetical protein
MIRRARNERLIYFIQRYAAAYSIFFVVVLDAVPSALYVSAEKIQFIRPNADRLRDPSRQYGVAMHVLPEKRLLRHEADV